MEATTTPTANIFDIGTRKYIPALVVTLPDGTSDQSKGARATKANVVAIWKDTRDGGYFWTAHKSEELARKHATTRPFNTCANLVEILPVMKAA